MFLSPPASPGTSAGLRLPERPSWTLGGSSRAASHPSQPSTWPDCVTRGTCRYLTLFDLFACKCSVVSSHQGVRSLKQRCCLPCAAACAEGAPHTLVGKCQSLLQLNWARGGERGRWARAPSRPVLRCSGHFRRLCRAFRAGHAFVHPPPSWLVSAHLSSREEDFVDSYRHGFLLYKIFEYQPH